MRPDTFGGGGRSPSHTTANYRDGMRAGLHGMHTVLPNLRRPQRAKRKETGMQQSITDSKVAATVSEGTLTIGLDLADAFTQLCSLDSAGTVVAEERVRTTTSDLQCRFNALPRTRVVLETGTHSP